MSFEARISDEPICDFCSEPKPTRGFDVADFPMDPGCAGVPPYHSKGAWMACATCGSMIDGKHWDRLLMRAVDRLCPKYPQLPRRILTDTVSARTTCSANTIARRPMTPEELKAALADPSTHVVAMEITPDDRERLLKATEEVGDYLIRLTRSPAEAALVLHFVQDALYRTMGLHHLEIGRTKKHES